MCIALFSTAHPKYALIVITNRDEYIRRPTARAAWWDSPSTHVLGGRDLERSVRGTWLGITSDGRIATLTNFRDEASLLPDDNADANKMPTPSAGLVSRGAMVNAYLTQPPGQVQDTETFARKLVSGEGAKGSGGFTLVCGQMGSPLAVVSNRMADVGEVAWIAGERGQTVGLSNAAFGDTSWPKVVEGEELMADIIKKHVEKYTSGANNKEGQEQEQEQEEALIQSLLTLLSRNTLPARQDNEGWATYVKTLKQSIFIPVVGGEDPTYYGDEIASGRSGRRMSVNRLAPGSYATSKQNVILVDHEGNVTFVEKTLYEDCLKVRGEKDQVRRFRYRVEVPGPDRNGTEQDNER